MLKTDTVLAGISFPPGGLHLLPATRPTINEYHSTKLTYLKKIKSKWVLNMK